MKMRRWHWALAVFSVLSLLAQQSARAAPREEPAQFVRRYYRAAAAAKTPFDTASFMSARVREKQKKDAPPKEMQVALAGLMMEMMARQPKQVKVVSTRLAPGKAFLELAPLEIPQHFKKMARDATSWSLKGEMVLVEEGDSWKVDKDIWKFSEKTKSGTVKESFGVPGPDDKQEKPSSPPR